MSSISTTVPMIAAPEEINLEGIPLPVYPLPMKPPPVQPPQKIGSGFAPIVPLDKSGKKVRHWRQVKREVRGIAGGRWFTQTWIGEKESEFATAAAAAASALQSGSAMDRENLSALTTAPGMALPKLPGVALSGRGPGRPRIHPKVEASLATNPSSRAQSIASDSLPSAMAPKGIKRTHTQMSSAAETPAVSTPIP
ncbi:hypothetical protein EIP86_005471 [Pleurotus ostreatoroseus]|nr:hypothetical protein EIP86_005471 [Pleurotus ostreatoroseus]